MRGSLTSWIPLCAFADADYSHTLRAHSPDVPQSIMRSRRPRYVTERSTLPFIRKRCGIPSVPEHQKYGPALLYVTSHLSLCRYLRFALVVPTYISLRASFARLFCGEQVALSAACRFCRMLWSALAWSVDVLCVGCRSTEGSSPLTALCGARMGLHLSCNKSCVLCSAGGSMKIAPHSTVACVPPPPGCRQTRHGLGVCIWMHLVNGTGNSPSLGQPTPESSNRTSHPGAPLTRPKHVRTRRGSECAVARGQ